MRPTWRGGPALAWLAVLTGCSSSDNQTPPATPALPACPEGAATAPNELRCTGLYTDWAKKTVSADVIPYEPGLELWSDGAEKQRYFLLPKGSKIDTSDPDEWSFPVGTKIWKEFRVSGKRIETRLYWKLSAAQWAWTTYVWETDETKANRLDTGKPNAAGNYEIPKVEACDSCHRGRKDKILGIEALALSQPEAQGLTLAKMQQDGMLSTPVTVSPIPDDATGKAKAALGYLHMNCGVSCHDSAGYSPAVESGLFFKLHASDLATGKVDQLPTFKTAVGQKIVGNAYFEYTGKGFLRIKPGVSQESLVVELAKLRDVSIQMPPVGTHQPDPQGRGAIESWIDAMPK